MNELLTYRKTLAVLFCLMEQVNEQVPNAGWERSEDGEQGGGMYGHLESAIESIAGPEIIRHWFETDEIDYRLANREPSARPDDPLRDLAALNEAIRQEGEKTRELIRTSNRHYWAADAKGEAARREFERWRDCMAMAALMDASGG